MSDGIWIFLGENSKMPCACFDSLDSARLIIQEQRLFKKVEILEKNITLEKDQSIMMETIKMYATKLAGVIGMKSIESYYTSQELDKNYPNRLISEKRKISQEEYEAKFRKLY